MDHLNSLSDEELRQRLLQYGLPNLPVTKTTRNTLIRRLRTYMEGEQAKLKRATTFATRYSSDEEASDQEIRRRPNTTMPPPKTNNRRTNPPTITKTSPRSQSVYVSPVVRHFNTDSEDDLEHQFTATTSNLNSSFSRRNIGLSPSSSISRTSTYYPSTYSRTFDRSNDSNVFQTREQTATTNGHSSNEYSQGLSTNYRRPALSTSTPSPRRSTLSTASSLSRTRYLNETFATAPNDADIVYQTDRHAVGSVGTSSSSIGATVGHFFTKLNEQFSIILGLFVVFFAAVAIIYISISPDLASTMNVQEAVYSLCAYDHPDSRGVVCVNNEDLNSTLDLIRLTATELQRRMELNKCKDKSIPFTMSAKEVVNNAMRQNNNYPLISLIKDLHNMEYLIKMNPQWSIANCDSNGYNLSFDDVIEMRKTQSNYFMILKPRLPFMCSLYNKMGVFFTIIGWIGLICSVVYGVYFIYRIAMDVIQSNRDKKNLLIADIITAVMEKAEDDPTNPHVVVNHLRDKLLSAPSRSNLEWAWDQAIDFLEKNDSRIKFEIGCRNGEDCRLMKWVDTAGSSGGKRAFAKKWQCSAYDKLNKIKDPPTQCLKIRQMFEKHEVNNPNLKQVITDALLEKAENKCKIHDIELDLNTCCVYVRCATPADAGMVHDLVNGWWFDGRLVSIKFLRIDRYMSRFPHSTGVGFLQPSNTNNSSMTYYVEESGRVRPQGADDD
ncbi:Inner nuclear membrane protein Man1 [Pseudolycoriella hygida]|uniref:Inner nuclear membrane protein Man1 n=1 Tax=Pseudolycoriella hygida TaxID=35572 RepID=A0A9Q0S3Y4_9DIPT|nr:Inner nuclear membrane protein Man1 [Pseudolycoriella hygida]